jgi:hypothetical protein
MKTFLFQQREQSKNFLKAVTNGWIGGASMRVSTGMPKEPEPGTGQAGFPVHRRTNPAGDSLSAVRL